jgi:ribosome-binding factor A
MSSHRVERVSEAIREVIAMAVLRDLADPRIEGVTVLSVEVTGDLRNATVYVTVMGPEPKRRLALRGLQHAAGFLQSKIAARLQTRFTPILTFKLDDGVKKSVEMSRLIDETLAADRAAAPAASEPAPGPPPESGG